MTHTLFLFFLLFLQAQSKTAEESWETTRGIAEAKFEILMMTIERQEWSKVVEQAKGLFSLPFPPDQEHLKVDAAREYLDKLIHATQFAIAHGLVDAAIDGTKPLGLKADLYREKGFVCQKEGDEECAMDCHRKSIELESGKAP